MRLSFFQLRSSQIFLLFILFCGLPSPSLGKTANITIPFEFNSRLDTMPVILLSINGSRPLRFGLDTGNGFPLIMLPETARRLGLSTTGVKIGIEGGDKHINQTKIVSKLAAVNSNGTKILELPLFNAGIVDDTFFRNLLKDQQLDGLTNLALFKEKRITFDFDAKKLTIEASAPKQVPSGTIQLPVDVDDDSQISLPVLLDGKVTVRVRMDTGSYRTIIPSDAADQLFPLGASTDVGGDVNGNYDTVNMLLSKLSIGNIEEPDIVVTHIEEATEALLGMDILSRFRLTLDLSEKTLFLERAKNYPQRKRVPAGDLLLFSTKEDYPVVTAVNPGSAADKAGVQKGDMVLEVDGIDLKKRPASEVRTLVTGYAEEETRLRIRRNGSEEQIIRYKRTSLFSPLAPVGLGINLRRKEEGLLFKFISIASPAQKVGLRVGDQIIEVNGLPVATTPMEEISRAVKQPEGTEVILKIRRKGVEKLLEFKLKVSKLN